MRSDTKLGDRPASRAARAALNARIDAWLDDMLECFDTLTDLDFEDLRKWENSAEFTRSTDWPGWARFKIGPRPGGAERPVPYLVREGRRA
ncbi:MAG: hypothetical protein WBX38_17040 [Candidatus Sulfotelmatobacter sp.]